MSVMAKYTDLRREMGRTCKSRDVYNCQAINGICSKVYVSFGGLLLYLDGPYSLLNALRIDYVYLLMKK